MGENLVNIEGLVQNGTTCHALTEGNGALRLMTDRTTVRGRARLVIGASDPSLRTGIRMAVADHKIVAEAESVRGLVLVVERHQPDVCLVDVDLSGGGLQAAAELSVRAPTVAVVLLTDDDTEMGFLDAMRAGATGYLPKAIAPEALPSIVQAVMRGEPAIPRAFVRLLINEYRQRPSRRYVTVANGRGADLTSREWQVLEFVRAGVSTREIASSLLISEVTVRRHISAALKKLQVESRDEARKLLQSA